MINLFENFVLEDEQNEERLKDKHVCRGRRLDNLNPSKGASIKNGFSKYLYYIMGKCSK